MRLLKILRALLNVGQKELAMRAGVSTRELARIEAGGAVPSRGTLMDLDKAFSLILKERAR